MSFLLFIYDMFYVLIICACICLAIKVAPKKKKIPRCLINDLGGQIRTQCCNFYSVLMRMKRLVLLLIILKISKYASSSYSYGIRIIHESLMKSMKKLIYHTCKGKFMSSNCTFKNKLLIIMKCLFLPL